MKTPPMTLRAMKPRNFPESAQYQSLNGMRSGVLSRNRQMAALMNATSSLRLRSVADQISQSVFVQVLRLSRGSPYGWMSAR